MKKTILKKYAELIVRSGLALRKGQPVIITANLDQEDFVSLVVEECYKAGASHVYLDWKSEKVARITNKKGKLKGTNPKVTEMAPKLTERQVAAFENHGELLSGNLYDNVYKEIKDASKKLLKVRKKGYKDHFKYVGSYDFEGRTVYVAKYQQAEIHIVDGCWQILRLVHKISDEELGYVKLYFEFQEYSRDVFLPVSGFIKFDIKGNEQINGSGMISYSYNYF